MSACLGVGAWLSHGSASAAGSPNFRLAWVRGDGAHTCVDQPTLEAAVRARLPRDPFDPRSSRSIEGSVSQERGKFRVRLSVLEAGKPLLGERTFEQATADCGELTDAIVLAVALTIDPEAAAAPPTREAPKPREEPAKPPQTEPTLLARAQPCPTLRAVLAAAPAPRCPASAAQNRAVGFGLSLRALGAFGVLPGFAEGVSTEAAVGGRDLMLTLGANWLSEQRRQDFGFGLSSATVGGCWTGVRLPFVRGALCASLELGSMYAVVYRLEPLNPGGRPFFALNAGLLVSVPLGLGLQAELGALAKVPVVRPAFAVQGRSDPIFESSAFGGVLQLGLGWAIPAS